MKCPFNRDTYIWPPGSLIETIAHPGTMVSVSLDIPLFSEHRYAFFFWNN